MKRRGLQMLTVLRTETLEGVGMLGIPRTALSRHEGRLTFIEVHMSDTRLIGVPGAARIIKEGLGELGVHFWLCLSGR